VLTSHKRRQGTRWRLHLGLGVVTMVGLQDLYLVLSVIYLIVRLLDRLTSRKPPE